MHSFLCVHTAIVMLLLLCPIQQVHSISTLLKIATNVSGWLRFDGLGGLSGGGATSNFFDSYKLEARNEILDLLFKPNYGAGLNILKVEIGTDDQTTDGCESCHMRREDELNCDRGYEWTLMKEAAKRNPNITLYGLPWGWAGWLGYNSTNPYSNPSKTADYIGKWIECGRDHHGLNISVIGLWNEADVSFKSQSAYLLALRNRLDSSHLSHVRIIVPDGDIADAVHVLSANATLRSASWGLGTHYPGARGTSQQERDINMTLWSSEDYSTYSDATGGGCWGRLLVQNAAWGYTATITWYLMSAYARGMGYDGDGLLRAEWPTSGHFEVTPMFWYHLHWSLFTNPGWKLMKCSDMPKQDNVEHNYPRESIEASMPCALNGGGNYAVLMSQDGQDISIIVETLQHNASRCIRNDPRGDWPVSKTQFATFNLPPSLTSTSLQVWRSCASWEYPAFNDTYMLRLHPDLPIENHSVKTILERDCYYTFTSVKNRMKPNIPSTTPPSEAFPLPYTEDFEISVGGEAPYFGDQMGKWETVNAGGGREGHACRQIIPLQGPWPILEPQCNEHSTPLSIIGDVYWEDMTVTADVLLEESHVGAALALRVRMGKNLRGKASGVFLWLGATPPIPPGEGDKGNNPGGITPTSSTIPLPNGGWKLCADSYCEGVLASGNAYLNGSSSTRWAINIWHSFTLSVQKGFANGSADGILLFSRIPVQSYGIVETKSNISQCQNEWHCKVPASGWAAIVSTLGGVQFDNFRLDGLSSGRIGAPACLSSEIDSGANVTSVPCNLQGAYTKWSLDANTRVVRSVHNSSLCLGSFGSLLQLFPCSDPNVTAMLARHDISTGRIIIASKMPPTHADGGCVSVQSRSVTARSKVLLEADCSAIPCGNQQFQFNPVTGALRHKGGQCIVSFPGWMDTDYRDCCLGVCNTQ